MDEKIFEKPKPVDTTEFTNAFVGQYANQQKSLVQHVKKGIFDSYRYWNSCCSWFRKNLTKRNDVPESGEMYRDEPQFPLNL